ncbi:UDP-N-acetylmuramoyl-tripeptide--D-alanyl-D-alanine ligase [Flavobacteriales bacterium]|nr:UDP-N-acetylmuramoyl-tripeptide--D-alanyl-D-alanine ligase [Flavobacteriales bacterium]
MSEIQKIYNLFLKCNQKICIDTRSKEIKNSLFICIKGDNFDGNNFAEEAIIKGAKYVITSSKKANKKSRIINVEDGLKTLQSLGKIHRQSFSIPVIGITGTNGKTTTKEILSYIMQGEINVCKTEGNLNNHIGVPLTLLKIKKKDNLAIIELGANQIGDITFLCSIADPTHGVITNIGAAHLSGFGNVQNILKAKSELYNYIKKKNGTIFIDSNNTELMECIKEYTHIHTYKTIDLEDESVLQKKMKFKCTPFIQLKWKELELQTKIIGNYNINNLICALTIAKFFKIKNSTITNQIKNLELKNNRSQLISTDKNYIILDAYNANPTSVKFAINNFIENNFIKKELVIILGDMLELGTKTIEYHQNIVKTLERTDLNKYILIGQNFQKTNSSKKFIKFNNTETCKCFLKENTITNSQILIKGSRKMRLEELVSLL